MASRSFPLFLSLLVVAIAVVNGFAYKYFWYWQIRWFDMPMHFSGGVWLAGTAFWYSYSRKGVVPKNFWSIFGLCLGASLGVGFAWEIYEAVVGLLTVGHINAKLDTLSDLSFDTLGGMVVAIWGWQRAKRGIVQTN